VHEQLAPINGYVVAKRLGREHLCIVIRLESGFAD
jgi:hypothetical protein